MNGPPTSSKMLPTLFVGTALVMATRATIVSTTLITSIVIPGVTTEVLTLVNPDIVTVGGAGITIDGTSGAGITIGGGSAGSVVTPVPGSVFTMTLELLGTTRTTTITNGAKNTAGGSGSAGSASSSGSSSEGGDGNGADGSSASGSSGANGSGTTVVRTATSATPTTTRNNEGTRLFGAKHIAAIAIGAAAALFVL